MMQLVRESKIGGSGNTSDGGGNGNTPKAPAVDYLAAVAQTIGEVDYIRENLTRVYATAPSGTPAEYELGECLQTVRKAAARLRKAEVELMKTLQRTLPGMD